MSAGSRGDINASTAFLPPFGEGSAFLQPEARSQWADFYPQIIFVQPDNVLKIRKFHQKTSGFLASLEKSDMAILESISRRQ